MFFRRWDALTCISMPNPNGSLIPRTWLATIMAQDQPTIWPWLTATHIGSSSLQCLHKNGLASNCQCHLSGNLNRNSSGYTDRHSATIASWSLLAAGLTVISWLLFLGVISERRIAFIYIYKPPYLKIIKNNKNHILQTIHINTMGADKQKFALLSSYMFRSSRKHGFYSRFEKSAILTRSEPWLHPDHNHNHVEALNKKSSINPERLNEPRQVCCMEFLRDECS